MFQYVETYYFQIQNYVLLGIFFYTELYKVVEAEKYLIIAL